MVSMIESHDATLSMRYSAIEGRAGRDAYRDFAPLCRNVTRSDTMASRSQTAASDGAAAMMLSIDMPGPPSR